MYQIIQLLNRFKKQRQLDMDDIKSIIKQDDNFKVALESFITKSETFFSFPDLNGKHLRLDLWNSLYVIASTTEDTEIKANCFSALRILSREKILLDKLFIASDWLGLIRKTIGLDDLNMEFTEEAKLVAIEAEKCLCNLVFNCNNAARECSENNILYNLNDRIQYYSKPTFPEEIKYFDMKLLFIITAVCPEIRKHLGDEKNAVPNLVDFLGTLLVEEGPLSIKSVDLACEILKGLFNLTAHIQLSERQKGTYIKLVQILRKYLLITVEPEQKRLTLHNNVIHLLTNVPHVFYTELVPSISSSDSTTDTEKLEYCEKDVSVLKEILALLKIKMALGSPAGQQLEIISPTIAVLYKGACADNVIRKYLRSEVLPPLKDIYSRPEEGTSLRNCLCRLLTTPVLELRDIVAEFLFLLCKKNVKRMIKYTGYGNSAGLFARRGLLGGKQDTEAADYSSESEDSDTDEYKQNRHKINPVLGCLEPPRDDVMAGMTEEQKEYEALQIVDLMDALTRSGTIKPCRIDENGRPVPIEHVLQLQETIKNNELCKRAKKIID